MFLRKIFEIWMLCNAKPCLASVNCGLRAAVAGVVGEYSSGRDSSFRVLVFRILGLSLISFPDTRFGTGVWRGFFYKPHTSGHNYRSLIYQINSFPTKNAILDREKE